MSWFNARPPMAFNKLMHTVISPNGNTVCSFPKLVGPQVPNIGGRDTTLVTSQSNGSLGTHEYKTRLHFRWVLIRYIPDTTPGLSLNFR